VFPECTHEWVSGRECAFERGRSTLGPADAGERDREDFRVTGAEDGPLHDAVHPELVGALAYPQTGIVANLSTETDKAERASTVIAGGRKIAPHRR